MNEKISHVCSHLGLAYKSKRIGLKIKQTELAARAGVAVDTVKAIEKGKPTVGLMNWLKLGEFLELIPEWEQFAEKLFHDAIIDPFEEYDRKQKKMSKIKSMRVR